VSNETKIGNPAPAPLAFCRIATDSGDVTVICEPVTDELAITPTFGMDNEGRTLLTGHFTLTHRITGQSVSDGDGCIHCCRAVAGEIAAMGLDWVAAAWDGAAFVAALTQDQRRHLATVSALEWMCDQEPCHEREGTQP
jgi:hypothetical protein